MDEFSYSESGFQLLSYVKPIEKGMSLILLEAQFYDSTDSVWSFLPFHKSDYNSTNLSTKSLNNEISVDLPHDKIYYTMRMYAQIYQRAPQSVL